jgi:hypothetical protein
VVVRTDLPLPQQAVQACHAAHSAGVLFGADPHTSLVLCGVPSRPDLERVAAQMDLYGIVYTTFLEPDLGGEVTALATAPLTRGGRKRLRHLKPWRHP